MEEKETKTVIKERLDTYAKSSGAFSLSHDAEERLLYLCELADLLSDEFEAESVQVSVEPARLHGVICVHMDEIILEKGRTHPFFEYLKASDFLHFSKAPPGMLEVCFGVKDLWVKR